ncbi:hypothetical protein [Nocardioides pantholopis]|uniref:hypothetical protein n=1 Tax=Nocardioides pantholopis TaxID=2483798 RepID=UPI000F083F4A|nr:hypothetical protein [Nocardioides pantholopis]
MSQDRSATRASVPAGVGVREPARVAADLVAERLDAQERDGRSGSLLGLDEVAVVAAGRRPRLAA